MVETFKHGIRGKVLRIVKHMYDDVKSCIKLYDDYSDFFWYSVGLRQGEVISPILVSLFLDDIELFLQRSLDSGIFIDDMLLILLLFSDDMALFGNSPKDLQNNLDLLQEYCLQWGLKVNDSKTKVMVFRKRGRLLHDENWTYNGQVLEIVDTFNYLGTVFSFSEKFNVNEEFLIGKALKAMSVLLINYRNLPLKPKTLCQLFYCFVGSILNYSCEIFGFNKTNKIERIHLRFCKRILKIPVNACTAGVYGELARYPLYVARYCRIIQYWCKVIHTDNIILSKLYDLALNDFNNGKKNWVSRVKYLLVYFGYSDVFYNLNHSSVKSFQCIFKQRVLDCFVQEWYGSLDQSVVLEEYRHFKHSFTYEYYLDVVPYDIRFYITRIRLSAHSLRIQTGRYGTK